MLQLHIMSVQELIAQGATPNSYVFNSLMNVNACDLSYTLYLYKDMKASFCYSLVCTLNLVNLI